MAQALYHFLQHSYQQYFQVRRLTALHFPGIFALSLSCLGCWQEVRYEPGQSGLRTQKVDAAEAEQPTRDLLPPPKSEDLFVGSETKEEIAQETEQETVGAGVKEVGDLETRNPPAEASSPVGTAGTGKAGGAARTGLAVWRMSSQWSMAVALQAKGRDVERYGERLEQAKYGAKLLGVSLPDLPVHQANTDRLAENLAYLLEEAGPRLASELNELHGKNHAALAELAIKSHVLLLSYTPSSSRLEPVVTAVRQAAEGSGLPESVWREVVDLLAARAEFKQVKAAIFQLHKRATAHLSGAKE